MDSLDSIPFNDEIKNNSEGLQFLNEYFSGNIDMDSSTSYGLKEVMFATILYLFMGNPGVDILLSHVPHMNSPLVKAGLKGAMFFVLLWFIYMKT